RRDAHRPRRRRERSRTGGIVARGTGLLRRRRPRDRAVTTAIEPAVALRGALEVPGIKGICQRSVLLGAVAAGVTEVRGFGGAADTESAITVARQLGVQVDDVSEDVVRVHGNGLRGLV